MIAKLIRDLWAKQIGGGGGECGVIYVMPGGPEHRMALASKLFEEAGEVAGAPWDVKEYADLLEVALTLANLNNISETQIFEAMQAKRAKKGGFTEGAIYYADKEHHEWGRAKNEATNA